MRNRRTFLIALKRRHNCYKFVRRKKYVYDCKNAYWRFVFSRVQTAFAGLIQPESPKYMRRCKVTSRKRMHQRKPYALLR